MSTYDIEHIWNDESGQQRRSMSLSEEEIREATLRFSSQNITGNRRLIQFDSIYKSAVLGAYLILLLIGPLSTAKILFTVSMILCLAYLILRNHKLHVRLTGINDSDPVISVLQKRYDALMGFYPEFFIHSAVTHPLFVFAGFRFYHFFRYGEDGFSRLLSDPVTYLFLILAFIIPYAAQKLSFRRMLTEMESIMDPEYNDLEEELKIIRIKTQRRRRKMIYMLMSFIGLVLLLTLILVYL